MSKNAEPTATEAEEFKPFDVEVEQAILGSILADNRQLAVVLAELVTGDFYDPLHARIFERMIVFDEDQRAVTPITLGSSLKNDPAGRVLAESWNDREWRDPGERRTWSPQEAIRDYLKAVERNARDQPPASVVDLCRIIVELRERRIARLAVEDAAAELWKGDGTLTAITRIVDIADKITLRLQSARGSSHSLDHYTALAHDVEKAAQGGKLPGITTGLAPLDRQLGGFMPGDFIVLAGRPGMGKSIAGVQFAQTAGAILDDHGLREFDPSIFSLEMTGKENAARMIAELDYDDSIRDGRTPLHYSRIIKGRLSEAEFERFVLLGQRLADFGVQVYDESRMTMQKIGSLARARAQLSPRKPFIVIDHLQIIGASSTYRGNRVEELTEITGQCKALAKRLDCPVLGLSQLSRQVESREDKRPVLADLRESGSIEQDADAVIFLYRAEYYLRKQLKHAKAVKAKNAVDLELEMERQVGVLEADVAKNRSGGTGDVRLHIDVAANAIRESKPEPGRNAPAQLPLDQRYSDPLDELARRTGA